MSIQNKFFTFNDTIAISRGNDIYKDVREKDDSITTDILKEFKTKGYDVKSSFIQGSFSTHTAIKSLDGDVDLDRGLVVTEETAPDNPVEIKNVVRDVLENRGFKNVKIKIPCVTADYASLDLHIDYPVYSQSSSEQLKLAVGKEFSDTSNCTWEDSDPKGLISWVNAESRFDLTSEQRDQYRRIVRYLKRWRDIHFAKATKKKIYSIGITVMVLQCFRSSMQDGKAQDLEALLSTVNAILKNGYFLRQFTVEEKYSVVVNSPTAPFRDIFAKHGTTVGTDFQSKLNKLTSLLEEAKGETDLAEQCKILRKVFGDDFPEDSGSGNKNTIRAVHSSAGSVPDHGGA